MAKTVKTTLELPADLVRDLKMRAVEENRRIKDVAAEALQKGLLPEQRSPEPIKHRVQFPLIHSSHPAPPGQELTPERVSEILIDQEVEWALHAGNHDSA